MLAFLASGCTSDDDRSSSSQEVRLFYPSDTSAAIIAEVTRFNKSRQTTSRGLTVSVVPFLADGVSAASRTGVGPSEARPAIWLASSSLALGALSKSSQQTIDCTSMATTDLGFVTRERDLFYLDQHEGVALFSQIAADSPSQDSGRRRITVQASPSSSSSGLSVVAMEFALQMSLRTDALAAALPSAERGPLIASQRGVARYFHSDQEMLGWLGARADGHPAVALSSRQQVVAQNSASPSQRLAFVRAAAPHLVLDYPLCRIVHPRVEAGAEEAQRLVHRHFTSKDFSASLRQLGFTTKDDQLNETRNVSPEAGAEILALWPNVRKPSAIAFVVDTSSGSPAGFRESVARELAGFAPRAAAQGDSLALIATSTRSEVLAPLSSAPKRFVTALEALPASGSAVPIDGLREAISLLDQLSSSTTRRAAVLLVTQADAASSSSVASLRQSSQQLLTRGGGALYIVALTSSLQLPAAAGIRALALELEATYVEADLPSFPQALRGILQEVE